MNVDKLTTKADFLVLISKDAYAQRTEAEMKQVIEAEIKTASTSGIPFRQVYASVYVAPVPREAFSPDGLIKQYEAAGWKVEASLDSGGHWCWTLK